MEIKLGLFDDSSVIFYIRLYVVTFLAVKKPKREYVVRRVWFSKSLELFFKSRKTLDNRRKQPGGIGICPS